MMCSLIVEVQINCGQSGWSWEASQVLPFAVLSNVSHFWKRNIVFYQFLLEEVSCIRENILREVYVVKVWEGMVQNSLS